MEREIIERICQKLNIDEMDIISIGETWSIKKVVINDQASMVRDAIKRYDLKLKDGREFYLKLHHLSKVLKEKTESGYDLME